LGIALEGNRWLILLSPLGLWLQYAALRPLRFEPIVEGDRALRFGLSNDRARKTSGGTPS
jgi:hypothetical protein